MPAIESEAKARTKARFDEVFQSYSSLAGVKNKSRKKRTSAEENIVLETFKNQLDLSKESANETTVNTYNAEAESPRFTKNKLRERIPAAEKLSNVSTKEQTQPKMGKKKKKTRMTEPVITGETLLGNSEIRRVEAQSVTNSVEQPSKTVKKKAKDDWIEDRDPTEYNDKDHLIGPLVQMSQEETDELREKIKQKLKLQLSEHYTRNECQTVPLNNEIGMRKRKKKKDLLHASELETSAMSLSELHDTPSKETVLHSQTHVLQDYINKDEDFSESKVKRVKKKTKTVIDDSTGSGIEERKEEKSSSRRVYDDSLILGVYIHRSDKLIIDLMVSRPLVKIHVIDQKTGEYVRKENSINTISSLCEQEGNEYILPLVTQAYDFKRFKSPVPEWDEQILFNERFAYFLQENEDSPNVILFFEILDLCNMDNINPNLEVQVQEKGFHKIAWAFLKLVGANEVHNVDTKLRLQLYYPPSRARIAANTHVYEWWLKYPRNRYPSTLYVTIKGLKLADNADPNSGTLRALQRELGSNMSHSDVQNDTAGSGQGKLKRELFRWTRLPGQACRIPNKHLLSLRAGHMGCFSVCFSNDGRTLAAACADRDDYPVLIYEIPSGQFLRELHGHLNVVYELCWSTCDQHLLTASSDGTARLWNFANETSSAVKVLPHPSFVYTAKFHPMADYLVVTGCYDGVIRVWNIKVKEVNGLLLQEFDGHKSFINTLCFDEEGLQMYSGDSSGLIIIWNTVISRRSQQNPVQHWSILKEIRENDMKGIPVNHLQVHPNGRRLLIHAKDSTLRIMDLRILAANKYIGATNYREKIRSAFTPCGTFVFAGSEDGIAYVWNAETGDQVAKYSELSYTAPLRDVAFHPHEHMVAFCAFGQSQPILVYIFDYKVAQLEAEAVQTPGNLSTFNNPENLSLQESSLSPADRFVSAARTSMRMLKVKQKLDSVLNGTNLMQPAPSLLSPHSKLRLSGPQNTQLIGGTSAFGSFSPVGQPLSRTPSIRLQMSNTDVKVSSLKIEAESMIPVQETVVALYDYTAHRSDELTIHRSDIIHVLYKDNDNWWFGSLANGQQGYFPANYVASEIQHEDDQSSTSVSHDYVHSHKEQFEAEESSMNSLMMSTGPSKSRDVKMMPQNDTDADSPVTHVSRMLQMSSDSSTRMTSPLREPSTSAGSALPEWGQQKQDSNVKPKKKKSLKHISSGKTNNAFEFEPTV